MNMHGIAVGPWSLLDWLAGAFNPQIIIKLPWSDFPARLLVIGKQISFEANMSFVHYALKCFVQTSLPLSSSMLANISLPTYASQQ